MWSWTRRRMTVSSRHSTWASIQALANPRICAANSAAAQIPSSTANGSGILSQLSDPAESPSARLSSAPLSFQTPARSPAIPASAIACITGPNAAFATNGSADTTRPRAIEQATSSAYLAEHRQTAPDVGAGTGVVLRHGLLPDQHVGQSRMCSPHHRVPDPGESTEQAEVESTGSAAPAVIVGGTSGPDDGEELPGSQQTQVIAAEGVGGLPRNSTLPSVPQHRVSVGTGQ